jgi:lysophospholipase L1-like esterase
MNLKLFCNTFNFKYLIYVSIIFILTAYFSVKIAERSKTGYVFLNTVGTRLKEMGPTFGLRDNNYQLDKPNNTFRIVLLGDSFTFGHGVEYNESYCKVLEKMLNNKTSKSNTKYEIINLGYSGAGMLEKVESFRQKGVHYHPDLVILQYLSDDITDINDLKEIYDKLVEEYIKNSNEELNKINLWKIKEELALKAWALHMKNLHKKPFKEVFERNVIGPLKSLKNITKEENVSVLIVITAYPGIHPTSYEIKSLKMIVDEYGWDVINIDEVFSKYKKSNLVISSEDSHPNSFGHKLMAEEIYKKLISEIPLT